VTFRSTSIVFPRQQNPALERLSAIKLSIPLDPDDDDDMRHTAIALEALRQFQLTKSWDFPNAFRGLVALGECLDRWSAILLAEFKAQPGPDKRWNAVASAIETLAVGAALSGRLSNAKLTTTDKLNALFDVWPERLPDQATREWERLYGDIRRDAEKLRDFVRARASATKGGQVGPMIDPSLLLPPLKRVLRIWRLDDATPGDLDQLREPYRTIARLHASARTKLPEVVASEYRRRMEWLERVRRNMDEDTTRAQVVESATRLSNAIAEEGIGVSRAVRREFDEAFEVFKSVQLDNAIKATQQLQTIGDPTSVLPALVPDRAAAAMEAADRFFIAADALIIEAEVDFKAKQADYDAQVGEQLQRDRQTISDSLERLDGALRVIGGESC
jgi:hypothetical protein